MLPYLFVDCYFGNNLKKRRWYEFNFIGIGPHYELIIIVFNEKSTKSRK